MDWGVLVPATDRQRPRPEGSALKPARRRSLPTRTFSLLFGFRAFAPFRASSRRTRTNPTKAPRSPLTPTSGTHATPTAPPTHQNTHPPTHTHTSAPRAPRRCSDLPGLGGRTELVAAKGRQWLRPIRRLARALKKKMIRGKRGAFWCSCPDLPAELGSPAPGPRGQSGCGERAPMEANSQSKSQNF